MQRNSSYKNFIDSVLWSIAFVLYESLSSIYLILPPLIGILFILFHNSLEKKDSISIFFIVISILVLEAQKGFLVFSLLIFFLILHKFIVPKINQSLNSEKLNKFLYIAFAYLGYVVFYTLLSQIFIFQGISIDFYIIYYIAFEYLIASILL
jgi:hypothetical protein